MPSECRWNHRGNTVKSPWTTRLIPTPGAVATATYTAEDGHELSADLYGAGPPGEPLSLMVVCHPRTDSRPHDVPGTSVEESVSRHPTYPEVIAAADLLAPGTVFQTIFVACPVGVQREPVEVGGALGVECDQVGQATKSPLIHAQA